MRWGGAQAPEADGIYFRQPQMKSKGDPAKRSFVGNGGEEYTIVRQNDILAIVE